MGIDKSNYYIVQHKNSDGGFWISEYIYLTHEEASAQFSNLVKEHPGNSYRVIQEKVVDLYDPSGSK